MDFPNEADLASRIDEYVSSYHGNKAVDWYSAAHTDGGSGQYESQQLSEQVPESPIIPSGSAVDLLDTPLSIAEAGGIVRNAAAYEIPESYPLDFESRSFHGRSSNHMNTSSSWKPTEPTAFLSQTDSKINRDGSMDVVEMEEYRKRLKEYTASVSGNPFPKKLSSTELAKRKVKGSFFKRNLQWDQHRVQEAERVKAEEEERNFKANCTFKPEINQYTGSRVREDESTSSFVERLYTENLGKVSGKPKTSEEVEVERECTFKPSINRSKRGEKRLPYWKTAAQRSNQSASDMSSSTPEREDVKRPQSARAPSNKYSFTPRVNTVPKNMQSVQCYLQEPAYERLSRPKTAFTEEDQALREATNTARSLKETLDIAHGARPSSAPTRRPTTMKPETFKRFLARQEATVKKKEMKVAYLQRCSDTVQKPQIRSKTDAHLKKAGFSKTFDERLEQTEKLKTERMEALKMKLSEKEKGVSFKPKISKMARNMRSRTVDEMCFYDMEKRVAAQRDVRHRVHSEELGGATFRPRINQRKGADGKVITSRLRVATEPESYLDRLRVARDAKHEKVQQLKMKRVDDELKECTFAPKIHDAPWYVKKIAETMAVTRKAEAASKKPERPDWR